MKFYDRVNWTPLRLILLHVGLTLDTVNWILGCVRSTNFVVLINSTPSDSFNVIHGLRHGFPLSPLLFLLIVEDLILLIENAKRLQLVLGIFISSTISLTHLFLVDDVVLFC